MTKSWSFLLVTNYGYDIIELNDLRKDKQIKNRIKR